jgi:hypothetical protein
VDTQIWGSFLISIYHWYSFKVKRFRRQNTAFGMFSVDFRISNLHAQQTGVSRCAAIGINVLRIRYIFTKEYTSKGSRIVYIIFLMMNEIDLDCDLRSLD